MITIKLTDEAFRQLQALKQKTEDKDEAAVVGNALRLYDAFTTLIMSGAKIFIHRADGSMVEAEIF